MSFARTTMLHWRPASLFNDGVVAGRFARQRWCNAEGLARQRWTCVSSVSNFGSHPILSRVCARVKDSLRVVRRRQRSRHPARLPPPHPLCAQLLSRRALWLNAQHGRLRRIRGPLWWKDNLGQRTSLTPETKSVAYTLERQSYSRIL